MLLQIDELGHVTINVADWDINESFPARTITTDYSTWIAYISRKEVPAGTPITDINYWKPLTRLSTELVINYQKFIDTINDTVQGLSNIIGAFQKRLDDMDTQMQSFIATEHGGLAFSNQYGNSEIIGITQKALTNSMLGVYQLISDVIGIDMNNVDIIITPDAFLKPNTQVNVSAIANYGVFDSIKIYFNNVLIVEEESIKTFSNNFTISEETEIKVEVMLLGRLYTKTKTIRISSDFFIGGGETYDDVYKPEYSKPYNGDPQGAYEIVVEQGQRIIIILPTEDVYKIEQIEMNDFNIPMDVSVFGSYTVYTSLNTYQAGTYTIDINY